MHFTILINNQKRQISILSQLKRYAQIEKSIWSHLHICRRHPHAKLRPSCLFRRQKPHLHHSLHPSLYWTFTQKLNLLYWMSSTNRCLRRITHHNPTRTLLYSLHEKQTLLSADLGNIYSSYRTLNPFEPLLYLR